MSNRRHCSAGYMTEHNENTFEGGYDLALKVVFNYESSILPSLYRECVPLNTTSTELHDLIHLDPRHRCVSGSETDFDLNVNVCVRPPTKSMSPFLPPHPNIVDMPAAFIDDVLVTDEAMSSFPASLPRSLDPEHCFGHRQTLYLVMRRRRSNLRNYLANNPNISMTTRCVLFSQVLEAVSHMRHHGVAHRDLKLDNILVDDCVGGCGDGCAGFPRLEVCDFGCSLAQSGGGLVVDFSDRDQYR